MKICIIGLGIIGMPVLKYLYSIKNRRGLDVCGYDIEERIFDGVKIYREWNKIPECDVYIITVPTKLIEVACKKINNDNCLIIIESTSPVGKCREIANKYGFKYIVHCPHRYYVDDPEKYGVKQLRVIGGIDEDSIKMGVRFYKRVGIPVYICSSIEIAEMCKITENAYRFVQIAFVEELRMIAEENNIDYNELRRACNTKWNIKLLKAKYGIKRICLPQDIRLLKSLGKSTPLLNSAILTDKKYKTWLKRSESS